MGDSGSGDETLFRNSLISLLVAGPATALSLRFLQAPYGKHGRAGWGPTIPTPAAWLVMESPTLFVTALLIPSGRNSSDPRCLALLAPFLVHYLHRTLLHPLRLAAASDRTRFPVLVAAVGFAYNVLNAYVQIRSATHYKDYASDGRFWIRAAAGSAVFAAGMWINVSSDRALVRLKREARGRYVVPRGGLFELVSSPNYFGAVMSWSLAGLGFFLFTCANLVPRARSTRRWYSEKFGDEYPEARKAVIPFLY